MNNKVLKTSEKQRRRFEVYIFPPKAIIALGILIFMVLFAYENNAQTSPDNSQYIKLKNLNDRTWLILPNGQPIFTHGINHIEDNGEGEKSKVVAKASADLGFNAFGYGCPNELRNEIPFIESWNDLVPMSMHRTPGVFSYRDIFDSEVQSDIENQIKVKCLSCCNNPQLIGYMWTDLPAWDLKNNHKTNWVEFTRQLPATAAGKKVYVNFLKEKYNDYNTCKAIYKTDANMWNDLYESAFGSVPESSKIDDDNKQFLKIIARTYYKLLGESTRKYDPNHLIFGDRFPINPNVDVLAEMLPYVDALAIQPFYLPGFPNADFERLHKISNKPIIICDFAIRFKDGNKEVRGRKLMENEEIAGGAYSAYIKTAFKTNYILGSHWCNLIDISQKNKKGIKQGIFNPGFMPRPVLHKYIKDLNKYLEENTPRKQE